MISDMRVWVFWREVWSGWGFMDVFSDPLRCRKTSILFLSNPMKRKHSFIDFFLSQELWRETRGCGVGTFIIHNPSWPSTFCWLTAESWWIHTVTFPCCLVSRRCCSCCTPPTEPGNDLTKEVLLEGGAVEWVDQPVPFRVIWGLLLLEGVVASATAHTHSNSTGAPMPTSQCKWPNANGMVSIGRRARSNVSVGPCLFSLHVISQRWVVVSLEEVLKTHICPWDHLSSCGSKLKHLSCFLQSFSVLNGGMKTEKSEFKTHKSFMCDQTLKFRIFWASSESLCLFSCSLPAFCSACVFSRDVLLWNAFPFFDRLQ